jgi:hypothetical protein
MGGQQKYITPGESVWAKKSIQEAEYCGEAAKKSGQTVLERVAKQSTVGRK